MRNPFSCRIRIGDDLLAAVLLAGVTLAVFIPWLFTGRALYWGDIGLYFAPLTVFLRANLLQGLIPFWNPELLCGTPFVGNPQMWPFSPISALLPFLEAHRFLMVMNVVSIYLAGLFCYRFLTRSKLRLGWVAGLFGALIYMLGGFVVSKAQFPNMLAALSFLPLCLLQTERLVRNPTLRQSVWLGLAFGLQMLSAHAQISLMTIYLCAFVAFASGKWWRRSAAVLLPRIGAIALAGGFAALISASEWLPTVELWHSAGRHVLGLKVANRFYLHVDQWTGFFWPNRFGHPSLGNFSPDGAVVTYHNFWETACYLGVIPTVLVLFAPSVLVRRSRFSAHVPFAIVAGAVCAAAALIPVSWTHQHLLSSMTLRTVHVYQGTVRGVCAGVLVLALIAPMRAVRRSRMARYGFFWAVVGLVCIWLAFGKAALLYQGAFYAVPGVRAFHDPARFLTGAALGGAVLAAMVLNRLLFRPKRKQGSALLFACVCIVATAIDLGHFDRMIYPLKPIAEINASLRKSVLVTSLHNDPLLDGRKGRILMVDSEGPWNYFTSYRNYRANAKNYLVRWADTSVPNLLVGTGILEAGAYEPLASARAQRRAFDTRHSTPFRADEAGRMSVDQVIAFRPHPLPQSPALVRLKAFQTRDNYDSIYYYKNLRFLPRVRFVDAHTGRMASRRSTGDAVLVKERPNLLIVTVPPSPNVRTLVIADSFYPGWHATLAGRPTPIMMTADGLRKVRVPRLNRRDRLVMTYRPTSVLVGIYLMLVGVALLAMTIGCAIASPAPVRRGRRSGNGWLFPDAPKAPVVGIDGSAESIPAVAPEGERDEEGLVEWRPGDAVEETRVV